MDKSRSVYSDPPSPSMETTLCRNYGDKSQDYYLFAYLICVVHVECMFTQTLPVPTQSSRKSFQTSNPTSFSGHLIISLVVVFGLHIFLNAGCSLVGMHRKVIKILNFGLSISPIISIENELFYS